MLMDDLLFPHQAAIVALGLDYEQMRTHAERIGNALRAGAKPQLKIVDTCRIDNGGILPAGALNSVPSAESPRDFLAFVPAAGAASRYSLPLANLLAALEGEQHADLDSAFDKLIAEGAANWPLPPSIEALIQTKARLSRVPRTELAELARDLNLPKALMPCVKEGMSFLAMKVREHARIPALAGEVYVTPPGMPYAFQSALAKTDRPSKLPLHFLEQGKSLSTLRFNADGSLFLDPAGKPSAVPAGHGALADLFPAAGKLAPAAHSLFIRNIDNVMGTGAAALDATASFLSTHRRILLAVKEIRAALAADDFARAATSAESLLIDTPVRPLTPLQQINLAAAPSADRVLWELQYRLFHTSPTPSTRARLVQLFLRPVNTVGQVPNTGKDVGGTPCFVEGVGDRTAKICVEVPHASEADKARFLANPLKATHFNPVFVAAEITAEADYYARNNRDFWLLSDKTYRGTKVLYHETVLYELLGNSDLANCTFLEVPRLVFHPHKTLADATNRHASHWLG